MLLLLGLGGALVIALVAKGVERYKRNREHERIYLGMKRAIRHSAVKEGEREGRVYH